MIYNLLCLVSLTQHNCFLTFIHFVACISSLFLFIAEQHSIVQRECLEFMESLVDGHLGCFHLLTTTNNATMNIHMQVFVQTYVFISFGQTPASRSAGLYGKFHFLKKLPIILQSGYTILHCCQQYIRVLLSPND